MFRFPWGDMHSLNLGWFLQKFNELREDWATAEAGIDGALDAEIEKAEDALSDVFDARDAAAASATAAAGSASAAGTSATAAQNSATAAASSATLANDKATAAGLSEAAAAQSATQAGNSATAAAGSATQASQSATNAAGSATAAGQSASAAAASAASIEGDVDAAAASATAAEQSATDAAASAAAAQAIASVNDSFPSRITPLSKARTLSGASVTIANGFITLSIGNGSTAVIDIFDPITLPAGTYKLIIDLIDITQFSITPRICYFGARINNTTYSPRLDVYHDTKIGKYEYTFTLTEQSTVEVITTIAYSGSETGTVKGFAYLDLGAPTTALGLALSN